jgi:virginiamycin B lyase
MIRGVPVTKRTGEGQSSEEAILKRKVIIAVEYLIMAILAIGTFYVVSMFTLFAPSSSTNQSHSQKKQPRVGEVEPFDRIPSTKASQTSTTSNPWGIAFDSLHEIVWVAEPGCEPKPTCSKKAPGIIGEYDLLDGSFIQDFPEPTGYTRPVFVAIDANGNVWFTEPNSNAIGELDPQNMTWNQWGVLSGSAPFDLTFDKNGNLWFTEFDANRIGFFNPHTHKLVENTIPTPDSNPYGIARDPLGNIWFTENRLGVGQIGSFTPTSSGAVAIVEHQVATTQPHLITADKKGNIWYSEAFGGSIGEYSPASGNSVNYPVSLGICAHIAVCKTHISGISVDNKGDIWFSDSQLDRVGYLIPTTGKVLDKTISNQNENGSNQDDSAYDGLAVDSYNNVWFTEPFSALIVLWPNGTVK